MFFWIRPVGLRSAPCRRARRVLGDRLTAATAALSISLLVAAAGCGGGGSGPDVTGLPRDSAPAPSSEAAREQTFGSLTTRVVGTAQPPVVGATNGVVVTGLAGATISGMVQNRYGAPEGGPKIAFLSERDGNSEIYTMNANGTGQIRLTNHTAADYDPAFSPDGIRIAFTSTRDGNPEIYTMLADGSTLVRRTNHPGADWQPTLSPNGSRIAFVSDREGYAQIYTMPVHLGDATRLTRHSQADEEPAFSPDGAQIVYSGYRGSNYDIILMNADGTGERPLVSTEENEQHPCFSPDGRRVAFVRWNGITDEIFLIDRGGGEPVQITRSSTMFIRKLTFSPDGKKIVFQGQAGNGTRSAVYSINVDGTGLVRMTNLPTTFEGEPSYSGAGRLPLTLLGAGGMLGEAAAGFLFGQDGERVTGVVAFDTGAASTRPGARVASVQPEGVPGAPNLVFNVTAPDRLSRLSFVNVLAADENPRLGETVDLPAGATGALVSFSSTSGHVVSVLPYAANRGVGNSGAPTAERANGEVVVRGNFLAAFDAQGRNLAAGGAKAVRLSADGKAILGVE